MEKNDAGEVKMALKDQQRFRIKMLVARAIKDWYAASPFVGLTKEELEKLANTVFDALDGEFR